MPNEIKLQDRMLITVNGPRRPGETTPLWRALAEVIEWKDEQGHFGDHRLIRNVFIDREAREIDGKNMHLPGTVVAQCAFISVKVSLRGKVYEWQNDVSSSGVAEEIKAYQSLLLLQADPAAKEWENKRLPPFTCLAGEISLARFKSQPDGWKSAFPHITVSPGSAPTAHASGLSLRGLTGLPWETGSFAGTFLVTQPFPAAPQTLHVTLDRESMQAEFEGEEQMREFGKAFRRLGALLDPQTPGGATRPHRWAGLALVQEADVPQFRWELTGDASEKEVPVRLARGAARLLLADQPPGEQDVAARGQLTAAPELVVKKNKRVIGGGESVELVVSFADKKQGGPAVKGSFVLEGKPREGAPGEWVETVTLKDVEAGYDALTAADLLRRQHGVQMPDPEGGEVQPALLWGFMPLADGWAQLPFLNLSGRVYADALSPAPTDGKGQGEDGSQPPLLSGAATFGNDSNDLFNPARNEQPWSAILLDGTGYSGSWVFAPEGGTGGWVLNLTRLQVDGPDVALNGFVWLGTRSPSLADALPSLDDWVAGLAMLPLRSLEPGQKFPPPFVLNFGEVVFENELMPDGKGRAFAYPQLHRWGFEYLTNDEKHPLGGGLTVFEALVIRGLLNDSPAPGEKIEKFWEHLPLVWRRHPQLPAVQNLPLTQSQLPPNYPSRSRQLAPFEPLREEGTTGLKLPRGLSFAAGDGGSGGTAPGALAWPHHSAPEKLMSAAQWKQVGHLRLASLAVPGLVHDPGVPAKILSAIDAFLPVQYRYGLPYTDELNALARPPKDDEPNQTHSPLVDAPAKEPERVLRRDTYAAHWADLAEKSMLAEHDADESLEEVGGSAVVKGLVEPYQWPVTVTLVPQPYPGVLLFKGSDEPLSLSGEGALRGLDGNFLRVEEGNPPHKTDLLKRVAQGTAVSFNVTSGSMAAHSEDGRMRDQRGLRRSRTQEVLSPGTDSFSMLFTELERVEKGGTDQADRPKLELGTLCTAQKLSVGGGATWSLWFRDLPFEGRVFTRRVSASAQDVNDPEADSDSFVHLTGYEWRLAGLGAAPAAEPEERVPLPLYGLHFYPLTLRRVEHNGLKPTKVEIVGRLQLPEWEEGAKPAERVENGNAVVAVFEREGEAALELKLLESVDIVPDGSKEPVGIWPLRTAGLLPPPELRWQHLTYKPGGADNHLLVGAAFDLFGARWELPYKKVPFEPKAPWELKIEYGADELSAYGDANVGFAGASVRLRREAEAADLKPSECAALLGFSWGDAATVLRAEAQVSLDLLAPQGAGQPATPDQQKPGPAAWLVSPVAQGSDGRPRQKPEKFKLRIGAPVFSDEALHLEFDGLENVGGEDLYLLPGMSLVRDPKIEVPAFSLKGFAAMAFAVGPPAVVKDGMRVALRMDYGGLELLTPCRWGNSLQAEGAKEDVPHVFGSSAGDILAGHTLSSEPAGRDEKGAPKFKWNTSLLLNGVVEVKNLLSWPMPPTELAGELPVVHFEEGENDVREEDKPALTRFAERLKAVLNLQPRLNLEGHASADGTYDRNVKLAKERANNVKKFILDAKDKNKKKIFDNAALQQAAKKSLRPFGFGSLIPLDPDRPDATENRRVEIRMAALKMPAALQAGRPRMNHLRHTIRILLNQHEVPADALGPGSERLLFDFGDSAWQFLAVVEHQLVNVTMGEGLLGAPVVTAVEGDRRWTTVQEVRFAGPKKFAQFLTYFLGKKVFTANAATDFNPPQDSSDDLGKLEYVRLADNKVSAGFQRLDILGLLLDKRNGSQKNELDRLSGTLLVEASAPHWLLPGAGQPREFTNLQYLPDGVQRAILSQPGDYALRRRAPGAQPPPAWLLLALPFVGRLQKEGNDRLDAKFADEDSFLQVDPVWYVSNRRRAVPANAFPRLPLTLASWEAQNERRFLISHFDLAAYRRWRRLDPATLEEGWFRIYHTKAERVAGEQPGGDGDGGRAIPLPSVAAALPTDSPGRLSRPHMLSRLFAVRRRSVPPGSAGEDEPDFAPDPAPDAELVWRDHNLYTMQTYARPEDEDQEEEKGRVPYGFAFAGVQIHEGLPAPQGTRLTRHAAAAALPANLKVGAEGADNPQPVSFAVSPYFGIDYGALGAEDGGEILLVFAELLCLDAARKRLRPVASQVWEREQFGEASIASFVGHWGREIHSRLAADSPIAVLRVRRVSSAPADGMPTPVTARIGYEFHSVAPAPSAQDRAGETRPLRLKPQRLHYAEGQFGGSTLPPLHGADDHGAENIELAPPQVRGVQPFYLTPAEAKPQKPWEWGLSAIRFSVTHGEGKLGYEGAAATEPGSRLWWVVTSHQVQFAVPRGTNGVRRLLPTNFRADAIASYLTAVPNLPLPQVDLIAERPDQDFVGRWQPVLPGAYNYYVTGARAGAPFAFRHFLLRQEVAGGSAREGAAALASGAVPVQHRIPRPPALPANKDSATALRTWESVFSIGRSLRQSENPVDDALIINRGGSPFGLEMTLATPRRGVLPKSGDRLGFEFKIVAREPNEEGNIVVVDAKPWIDNLTLVLLAEGRQLSLAKPSKEGEFYRFLPVEAEGNPQRAAEVLQQFVSGLPHGAPLSLQASVEPPAKVKPPNGDEVDVVSIKGYRQTMTFPLRLAHDDRFLLPLLPAFTTFEDPEYNRRLTSQPAQATQSLAYSVELADRKVIERAVQFTLAADRQEYNPTSELLVVFFSDRNLNESEAPLDCSLTIKKVDRGGVIQTLVSSQPVQMGTLLRRSLADFIQPPLVPGDVLLLTLRGKIPGKELKELGPIELRVDIVRDPVTPAPEAGYALLRGGGGGPVECARFAWGPQPQRIELINPDDLKDGPVRRRAVFQWVDTRRAAETGLYELQKITPDGATHFPPFTTSGPGGEV